MEHEEEEEGKKLRYDLIGTKIDVKLDVVVIFVNSPEQTKLELREQVT